MVKTTDFYVKIKLDLPPVGLIDFLKVIIRLKSSFHSLLTYIRLKDSLVVQWDVS